MIPSLLNLFLFFKIIHSQDPANYFYSSHKCVGGHDTSDADSIMRRKCIFFNVCHVEGGGDEIEYYVDPTLPSQPILAENNIYTYDFGDSYLHLGTYEKFSRRWSPKVREQSMPNFAFEEASRVVLIESFCERNPGHFIDLLHSVFALQMILGYKPTTDIRVLDTNHDTHIAFKHRNQLMVGLSKHHSRFLDQTGNVCFRQLFVGAGYLSVLQASELSSVTAVNMRNEILNNLNISYQKPTKHLVLIFKKSTNQPNNLPGQETKGSYNDLNHIKNHNELLKFLQEKLKDIADVMEVVPDDMTWNEQLVLAQSATVIITPPGGGSYLALFARTGCSIIISDVNFGVSVRAAASVGQDDNWWTWTKQLFSHYHYPVCPGEYDGDITVVLPRMYYVLVLAMIRFEQLNDSLFPPSNSMINHYRLAQEQGNPELIRNVADVCSITTNNSVV